MKYHLEEVTDEREKTEINKEENPKVLKNAEKYSAKGKFIMNHSYYVCKC